MEVQKITPSERLSQALAHTAKCRIVQIAVICNETNDALVGAFDLELSQTKKLHVIIVQPLRIALVQWRAIDLEVAFDEAITVFTSQQAPNPVALVSRNAPSTAGCRLLL